MDQPSGLQKIGSLIKPPTPPVKKPPAYQWQDFALEIIEQLQIPAQKRNSVFQICKKYPRPFIEKCLNDTKELAQTGEPWRYFFKLITKPPTSAGN